MNQPPRSTHLPQQCVLTDRKCKGCGHNVRGMPTDGRCPECGLAIRSPRNVDAPLCNMPMGVVKRFRLGSWLGVAAIGMLISAAIVQVTRADAWIPPLIFTVAGCVWFAAAWLLTPGYMLPQAVRHGFGPHAKLRLVARLSQLAWIGHGLLQIGLELNPGDAKFQDAGSSIGVVTFLAGLVGIVLMCIMLSRLSQWVCDDRADGLFNGVAFAAVTISLLTWIDLPIPFIYLFLLVGTWATVLAFPLALLSLMRSLNYSVHHADDLEDREERRRQQVRDDAFQTQLSIAKMDEARRRRRT